MVAHVASAAGVRGLTVDYRLAPEYPFPLAIEDGMSVYRWLLDSGVDHRSLAVGGDSAGGCIAAGLLVAIRDADVAQPAAAVLFSPLLDLEARSETMDSNDESDFMNGRDVVLGAAESYLAGQDPSDPQASPINADPNGLPPMLLQVGRDEVLLGEVESFAKQAAEAGVEVELQVMDGVQHLFQLTAGAEGADAAISSAGAFVAAHLKITDPAS